MNAGAEIVQRRRRLRMSQQELADAAKMSKTTLQKIEHNDETVTANTVDRLRDALERLERRFGVADPDQVIQVLELDDGTKVTYTGTAQGVAEAAAEFLRRRTRNESE